MIDNLGLRPVGGLPPGPFVWLEDAAGMQVLWITNGASEAWISLLGGQVLGWRRVGQPPVLWLSPLAKLRHGHPIRGGIPVCWPWFGPASDPGLPSHGVARTAVWDVAALERHPDGTASVRMTLPVGAARPSHIPPGLQLSLTCSVGDTLTLELWTENAGPAAVPVAEALHTYFHVGDVRQACVRGLESVSYVDQLAPPLRHIQQGPVTFCDEVDRVYLGSPTARVIEDPTLGRRLHITTQGSASTVLWNPWIKKSLRLPDMTPDGYLSMVCVESGNALDDTVPVAPGAFHCLRVEYREERLTGS